MTNEPADWADEVARDIAKVFGPPEVHTTAMAMAQMQRIEYISKQIRSHAPTPPPMPEDVKELAALLINHVGMVAGVSELSILNICRSFLASHDQKRDAETIALLAAIREDYDHPWAGEGDNARQWRMTQYRAITTHLQKLKGAK